MGLADVAKGLQSQRQKKAAQRLFQYVRDERSIREKPPLQVGDTFRASSLPYLCPREEVLANKYDVIRAETVQPSMEITWSIGHLYHELYRDIYYGPMQEWAGAWECLRCGWNTDQAGLSSPPVFKKGLVSKGKLARMPGACASCGAPFVLPVDASDEARRYGTFLEWKVSDKNIGLHGHPDGWSWRNGFERIIVDLKSHGYNGFSSRNMLRDGHDLQIWAYEHMCGDKDGEVWYLNKSPWGDPAAFVRDIVSPFDVKKFKMFVVQPLALVHNGIAGGPMPERGCINQGCVKATECQLADVCFEV